METSIQTRHLKPVDIAGSHLLVIVGTGKPCPDSWNFLARSLAPIVCLEACAINGAFFNPTYRHYFRHWFTQHPDKFFTKDTIFPGTWRHTIENCPDQGCDKSLAHTVWDIQPIGDSALIATILALDIWGYDKVLLTGVPLTDRPYTDFQACWVAQTAYCKDRIASTHGWTQEHFGYPTEAWVTKGLTHDNCRY